VHAIRSIEAPAPIKSVLFKYGHQFHDTPRGALRRGGIPILVPAIIDIQGYAPGMGTQGVFALVIYVAGSMRPGPKED
jgi:hypothetical protein